MRIAFNIDYQYPHKTGIGRYGLELIKAIIRMDVPCDVWMTGYMKEFPPASREITERTSFYPWPRRITDFFWPAMESRRLNIGWVHSSNGQLLPRNKAFRQVCMIHDMGPFNYGHMKESTDTKIWRNRIRNIVKNAECIAVNSTSTADDVLQRFPEVAGKVFLTPLGIDHFQRNEEPAKTGEHILNVGTVDPRKNVDNLIRAYAILSGHRDVPPLIIAGKDGFKARECRQLAVELGVDSKVNFTGYISEETLIDLYSRAACLVHPAHHEGFGFTVPEAFPWDLPVAGSCTGGLGEFFGKCMWQVDPEDPESIAAGMENALFKGVTTKQKAARDSVTASLTWENCAAATLKAMKTIESRENS